MASKTFLVTYSYVPDMVERRQPHRSEHLAYLKEAFEKGQIIMAGAVTDPVDGGLLIMRADESSELLAFAANDPYAKAGLLRGVTVREWTVVLGLE